MTGCTPKVHKVQWNSTQGPCRRRTLAQIARDAGYNTTAITSWGGFVPQQVYHFEHTHSEGRAAALENRGDQTLARSLAFLDKADPGRPQFLWVHIIDPHAPDIAPDPY